MRKFIPNLAAVIAPLVDLTKPKDAVQETAKRWSPEQERAFTRVQQLLTEPLFCIFQTSPDTLLLTSMLVNLEREHS